MRVNLGARHEGHELRSATPLIVAKHGVDAALAEAALASGRFEEAQVRLAFCDFRGEVRHLHLLLLLLRLLLNTVTAGLYVWPAHVRPDPSTERAPAPLRAPIHSPAHSPWRVLGAQLPREEHTHTCTLAGPHTLVEVAL